MNPSQNQRKEAGSSGVGGSSALTNQVVDQEMRVVQNENNAYTDDPNEAVKEVLRQILDEESKKNNIMVSQLEALLTFQSTQRT